MLSNDLIGSQKGDKTKIRTQQYIQLNTGVREIQQLNPDWPDHRHKISVRNALKYNFHRARGDFNFLSVELIFCITGLTSVLIWFKSVDTLIVFLKELFRTVNFENNSADDNKRKKLPSTQRV